MIPSYDMMDHPVAPARTLISKLFAVRTDFVVLHTHLTCVAKGRSDGLFTN
jgi:hypothetical protein